MKTIKLEKLTNVVGGQAANVQNAVGYGTCMNKAVTNFASANQSTMQQFQGGKISQDEFMKQGVASATSYQGAAADCAKQFPLQ